MKKNLTFSAIIITIMLTSFSVNATKWRVNNTGVAANFTTIQAAHNGASAGDTLYIESSRLTYGNLTCAKRLVIIGTGYFLDENDSTQANIAASVADYVSFNAGSENSIMMGMTITAGLNCGADQVLVQRNYLTNCALTVSADNVVVTQCYIYTFQITSGTNLLLSNSVVSFNTTSGYAISMSSSTSGTIRNNIVAGGQVLRSADYYNNISTGVTSLQNYFNATSCSVYNNIGASSQYTSYPDSNQLSVNMNTVFVNTGSTDGKYQLIPGTSPAIDWGHDGVDCGIYGGPTPYIPSGMPTVPAIWYLQVEGTNVTVKAKSH